MAPFGKQQEILNVSFNDKSARAVRKPAGTLFVEGGVVRFLMTSWPVFADLPGYDLGLMTTTARCTFPVPTCPVLRVPAGWSPIWTLPLFECRDYTGDA